MNPLRAIADNRFRLYPPGVGRPNWRAAYYDSTGQRRFITIAVKSRAQAEAAIRRLEAAAIARPSLRDGRGGLTVSAWMERWRELHAGMLPRTRKGYERAVALILNHFGDADLETLSRADAADWYAALEASGVSRSTARGHAMRVKAWAQEAVDLELLPRNPFALLQTAQPTMDADWPWIGPAEMRALLRACPDARWRALLALCRYGGLRAGEAFRADQSHVRGAWLIVANQGEQTTKRRERAVPIRPELGRVLDAKAGTFQRSTLLCGGLHRTRQFGPTLDAIIRRAGLQPWPKPLHTLRRCAGCEWAQVLKVDAFTVARYLGHSPAVAQAWYARPIELLPRVGRVSETPKPKPQKRRKSSNLR